MGKPVHAVFVKIVNTVIPACSYRKVASFLPEKEIYWIMEFEAVILWLN